MVFMVSKYVCLVIRLVRHLMSVEVNGESEEASRSRVSVKISRKSQEVREVPTKNMPPSFGYCPLGLARMVWGTYLENNCTGLKGHLCLLGLNPCYGLGHSYSEN